MSSKLSESRVTRENSDLPDTAHYPFVSIIVPCLNEEAFIAGCLDSLAANDYPKERVEVLCVDGMSADRTQDIIHEYAARYPWIKLLLNPAKSIPAALNVGIRASQGEVILRCIAHALYERDHVSRSVLSLDRYKADNVGGLWVIRPRKNTVVGRAISTALADLFGAGNAHYRLGVKQPRWVDLAFPGCSRRELFERTGLFNENLERSEDVGFARRLRAIGARTLLVPEIVTYYYARSGLWEFAKHNFLNGIWVTYPLKFVRSPFSWRHWVPLAFVSGPLLLLISSLFFPAAWQVLLLLAGLYLLINLGFSVRAAARRSDASILLVLPLTFFLLHVPYGLGSLWGLLKVLPTRQFWAVRLREPL